MYAPCIIKGGNENKREGVYIYIYICVCVCVCVFVEKSIRQGVGDFEMLRIHSQLTWPTARRVDGATARTRDGVRVCEHQSSSNSESADA